MSVTTPACAIMRPIGLDFTAALTLADAAGADTVMLAEILPRIEAAIIAGGNDETDGGDDGDT